MDSIFDDPTTEALAAELAREADGFAAIDPDVHGFRVRAQTELAQLAAARTARGAARAAPGYPRAHLAAVERQVEQAKAAVRTVEAAVAAAADDRARRAANVRSAHLNAALARPEGVDQTADRLDLQEARSFLRSLDPVDRAIRLKRAAQEGARPELIRAALTALEPMLTDRDAREIRERVLARRAPETVRELLAVRHLRKLASDLDLAVQGYTPASLARPAPALRDGPHGVKVLDG
jgi:hypothetical protein